MRWAALMIVGAALGVPSLAAADAIEMPASCPAFSEDAFCHGPATCRPRACIAATDCELGEVCAAQSLCTETHSCFGFPMTTTVPHVLGSCDAAGACPSGGTCGGFFVCSPGPTSMPDTGTRADAGTVPEHVTACACRAGRGGGALGLAIAAVVLAALAARRR